MGLLAFNSGSDEEESWRSDDDDDDDPAVERSGAGAKADVCSSGTVTSARAATTIFMLIVWTTTSFMQGGADNAEHKVRHAEQERDSNDELCFDEKEWKREKIRVAMSCNSCVAKYSIPGV